MFIFFVTTTKADVMYLHYIFTKKKLITVPSLIGGNNCKRVFVHKYSVALIEITLLSVVISNIIIVKTI
jgi:hypothetical protein